MADEQSKTISFLNSHWLILTVFTLVTGIGGSILAGWIHVPPPAWIKSLPLLNSLPWAASHSTGNPVPQGKAADAGVPDPSKHGESQQSTTHQNQGPASVDEYVKRRQSLSARFLEQNEYVQRSNGALVQWEGVVASVKEHSEGKILVVILRSRIGGFEFIALMPPTFRTKAFSLQPGDVVQVIGTLELSTPSYPVIDGSELVVISLLEKK